MLSRSICVFKFGWFKNICLHNYIFKAYFSYLQKLCLHLKAKIRYHILTCISFFYLTYIIFLKSEENFRLILTLVTIPADRSVNSCSCLSYRMNSVLVRIKFCVKIFENATESICVEFCENSTLWKLYPDLCKFTYNGSFTKVFLGYFQSFENNCLR